MIRKVVAIICLSMYINFCAIESFSQEYVDHSVHRLEPTKFKFEHIDLRKPSAIDLVKVTRDCNVIVKNNLLPVEFCDNFTTKKYKGCDVIEFRIPYDIVTKECSLIIPKGTTVLARIECIKSPKIFNRNAKVYVYFKKMIFPKGDQIDFCAKPYENDGVLRRSRSVSACKVLAYTIGGFGLGAGNGAWIGACASNTWKGTWIGMAIGGGVGLVAGLVSPGLHYKAKKGKIIYIKLEEDMILPKNVEYICP